MLFPEKWIWLPEDRYPELQICDPTACLPERNQHFPVAEFRRTYTFLKKVVSLRLRFSGDTAFRLELNGKAIAAGPVSVGGDFFHNTPDYPRDNFYSQETVLHPDTDTLEFFARVRANPLQGCEFSRGHGGFMLAGLAELEDGTLQILHTGNDWQTRLNGSYVSPDVYDGRIAPEEWLPAALLTNIWKTETAPIPVRTEVRMTPEGGVLRLAPGEKRTEVLELDMVYGGFVSLKAEGSGLLNVHLICRELEEEGSEEKAVFEGSGEYTGFRMHSAGNLLVEAENTSDTETILNVTFIATWFPVTGAAETVTSDPDLNLVTEVCRHTLKVCRQTHHLDSPRHCEPLACTGDYYIESLMTAASFGDMRLAEFDLTRTAELLRREDGRMFHTTYSLIWVRMLWDVYMITGRKSIAEDCEDALIALLNRFAGYVGETGLIENPPDYMFIDWIYVDEISMHHPPKALGQTCLNMFYYMALVYGAKLFALLGEKGAETDCLRRAESLKKAVNRLLYDEEKGMYFEGLNTPSREEDLYWYLSQNPTKRYYLKHSDILAAYTGICGEERGRMLVRKILAEEIPGDVQPYFTHFLLEAILRNGLREEGTLQILNRWKQPCRDCPKGLAEGFVKPEPTYQFDHSHAWGGTPLWSLPVALLGLEILEPGMTRIRLNPSLLGLDSASVEFPTPFGKLVCRMEKGKKPEITCPEGITLELA